MALNITAQVTLNEEIVVGSRLSLGVTLEGIIPIKIPCLDIGGTNLGSWCPQRPYAHNHSHKICSVNTMLTSCSGWWR